MPSERDPDEPKIYFLPNLMTACNLACGFFAVLMIFKGITEVRLIEAQKMTGPGKLPPKEVYEISKLYYEYAILLIFGSCLFDLIALVYLVCGAMRLARFNCLAALPKKPGESNDFRGLPIPMAAGFIASLTFLLIDLYQNDHEIGMWKYILAGAMLGLSLLMISDVRYPSFKKVGWNTKGTFKAIVIALLLIFSVIEFRYVMPVVLFSLFLLYGLIRPWVSQKLRKEIEVEVENEDDADEQSKIDV